MSIEENKKLVARFWDAFSKSEFDTALAMLSDNGFTWWIAGDPEKFPIAGLKTKEDFIKLLSDVSKAVTPEGIQMKPYAWTAEGDRVAMEAESYAKMLSGKVYNNKYHFLHIVKDGKLQTVKEYLDTTHATEILCT